LEILRTENLTKKFGGLTAVSGVNFRLEQGEIQSIIGPNGAGKSTLFKLINGEQKPTHGRIWFQGEEITGVEQHIVSRRGIATSYQITNIFPKLTTFENVRLSVQSRKTSYNLWSKAARDDGTNEKAEEILGKIGLANRRESLAAYLSYGEQRHLEIGIALGTDPVLLLLDEPTSGLSPVETKATVELIREVARGLSVILVEHKMKVVMDLSDKITVLHEGKVIAQGNPQEIRANETVRRVYLGGVRE
jgi:branched-chain amino acid transport system ATP-binding protein